VRDVLGQMTVARVDIHALITRRRPSYWFSLASPVSATTAMSCLVPAELPEDDQPMRGYLASQAPWRAALLQALFFVVWMTVVVAAATGKSPDDPALVPAAVALAHYRLAQHVEYQTLTLVALSVVGALLAIWIAFGGPTWCVAGLIAVVALLIRTARYPTVQRRRIAALEAPCVAPIRPW
jgi:hypothetical protein